MRLFSTRHRPPHLGPYPLERLTRRSGAPSLAGVPADTPLPAAPADGLSIVPAILAYQAMFDALRDGAVNPLPAELPEDPAERSRHLKAAAYYFDASAVGLCALTPPLWLPEPRRNPGVAAMADALAHSQPQSFAAGIDLVLSDVIAAARGVDAPIDGTAPHTHALVIAIAHPRDPRPGEPGCDWLLPDVAAAQDARGAVLAAQCAVLLSSYLRLLGHAARAHTAGASGLWLNRAAVAAGLLLDDGQHPYFGQRFSLAAVSTALALAVDTPLAPPAQQNRRRSHGLAWRLGRAGSRSGPAAEPFTRREFRAGPHPFETLARRDEPTTFIDHARVPRFPKRADFFARALFGDLGADVQEAAKNAHYVMKSPIGACARRALGGLLLLQFGGPRAPVHPSTRDPQRNADAVKATAYWLGIDAAGLCAVPEWAWYSHDAAGQPLPAYHGQAINLLIDQGWETMEGASGDDWISVAQSMRAYLRFSLLGGIVAEQLRRLGWSARVHSVLDGDVLQPPLLLLSGLGEVSRIGEVILNPFLGPRLKSGTVTTDMPLAPDRPIDFGLQRFCEACQKCARECPSGAITAGPKRMVNGYEIWKSDAEKCARYRITNSGGGMCGRCMKTCPWNLEGLLADAAWRWAAQHLPAWVPAAAPLMAALDDRWGRGNIRPVKTWWWDLELDRASGRYVAAARTHRRAIQPALRIDPAEQSLAVYPADRMPPPWPVPHPVNREEGLTRYRALLSPSAYRERLARGETEGLAPPFRMPEGEPPVMALTLAHREDMATDVARYELVAPDGRALPEWAPGAHVDVVIAPEYRRAYSLAGDPADRSRWMLGVQREPPERGGRGGSALMHRAFRPGRRVFVSRPVNLFPLDETASFTVLMAGGIGITPLLPMAHRLHALGRGFVLHYSVASRARAGFLDLLASVPWRGQVHLHIGDEGGRADLAALLPRHQPGFRLYACGALRYMDAVFAAAQAAGWPDEALRRELFSAPPAPPRERHPFTVQLGPDGAVWPVPAERSAAEVLNAQGVAVPLKCSDGLCGVCAWAYDAATSGPIDHRDHVLGAAERQRRIVLCCSRPAQPGGLLRLHPPAT